MNPDGNLNYFSDGFQIFWMYMDILGLLFGGGDSQELTRLCLPFPSFRENFSES